MDLAALLSPLGLLAVPGDVTAKLHKGLPLTPDEQSIVERGPEAAANIIRNIPRLGPVARIVHLRNRGFNGTGFPVDGPSGEAIPLGARVLCILTDLSAACRTDMPVAADFKVLEAHAGRYDPALLQKIRACLEVAEQPAVRVGSRMIATGFLRPGMVLAADIATTGGVLVLASRQVISEAHVEKLRNLARLRHITDAITVND